MAAVALAELSAAIRSAASAPHHSELLAQLRDAAARAVAGGPPAPLPWSLYRRFADDGERGAYEERYFARRGQLNALAVTALVDPDPAPAVVGALADTLWSVCDEYTWALPAHEWCARQAGRPMPQCVDLFAAETAHAVAEIAGMLAGVLPEPVLVRARDQVRHRLWQPLCADTRPWPWESLRNNWAAVCGGAAGMALLALDPEAALDPGAVLDPEVSSDLGVGPGLRRCVQAMRTFLSGLTGDGGCPEGTDYWGYGFGYFTYFAEALRAHSGRDLLTELPLARAAAAFPAAAHLGGGQFVTFSDALPAPVLHPGLVSRLRDRLAVALPPVARVPGFGDDWCHRWAPLTRNLAWTAPSTLGDPGHPVGTSWLPELGWLVDRRRVGDVAVVWAVKGGHNDEPHNHLDLGSFVLSCGGEQILVDPGPGEYTGGYFGPDRYAHLHAGWHGHSVPVVDGQGQRAGPQARAVVSDVDLNPDRVGVALDLSAAYPVPVRRHLRWDGPDTLVLTDTFDRAREVVEVLVSWLPPQLGAAGAQWRGRHATVRLGWEPARWSAEVQPVPVTGFRAAAQVLYRLRLRAVDAGVDRAELRLVVHPSPGGTG